MDKTVADFAPDPPADEQPSADEDPPMDDEAPLADDLEVVDADEPEAETAPATP